ncbi:MAG: hypothetical protein U1E45_12715 [Geminicoccaceae bacterium]
MLAVVLLILSCCALPHHVRAESTPVPGEIERVQQHGNRLRGLTYVPLSRASDTAEPASISMRPVLQIPYDGDRGVNVRGGLLPIDADGDGTYEFLHYNGYRTMRVYARDGTKLWQIDNPNGRLHRTFVHRDAIAVLDTNGDGRQEIIHCWVDPATGKRKLMRRDGATGAVLAMSGQIDGVAAECQLGVFNMAGSATPVVLLSRAAPKLDGCTRNYVDEWSSVTAFDMNMKQLWRRTTCNAGHYPAPLDVDNDGVDEGVFVGKYLYDATGKLICTLPGWGTDHVDAMVIGDFDPGLPGKELLAVGTTGTRFYSTNCTARWTIKTAKIRNPQNVGAVRLDPSLSPVLFVRQRGSEPLRMTYRVSAQGLILSSYSDLSALEPIPQQNANVDGATADEDLVAWFGQVLDANGTRRLSADWYWSLQTLLPGEETLSPYDQWSSAALAFDLDHDGQDEIIVWGRERIVVGKAAPSAPVSISH